MGMVIKNSLSEDPIYRGLKTRFVDVENPSHGWGEYLDWLKARLAVRFAGKLKGWLTGWLFGWAGLPVGGYVGCLAFWLNALPASLPTMAPRVWHRFWFLRHSGIASGSEQTPIYQIRTNVLVSNSLVVSVENNKQAVQPPKFPTRTVQSLLARFLIFQRCVYGDRIIILTLP